MLNGFFDSLGDLVLVLVDDGVGGHCGQVAAAVALGPATVPENSRARVSQ